MMQKNTGQITVITITNVYYIKFFCCNQDILKIVKSHKY